MRKCACEGWDDIKCGGGWRRSPYGSIGAVNCGPSNVCLLSELIGIWYQSRCSRRVSLSGIVYGGEGKDG